MPTGRRAGRPPPRTRSNGLGRAGRASLVTMPYVMGVRWIARDARTEDTMPTRTAKTAWTGTLLKGSGRVEMTSSGVGAYDVSFPKRAADEAGGTTSPEELIAA